MGHSSGILVLQQGLLFENWVILEVIARLKDRAKFYYWRTKKGDEVDLIVEKEGRRTLIEVKTTEHPSTEDFEGLVLFKKKYGCDAGWVVCQVSRPQRFGDFTAIPWSELGSLWN